MENEFKTISVRKETFTEIVALNGSIEPNMSRHGFMQEMVDFYKKYHCPQCGTETAVIDKHHKC